MAVLEIRLLGDPVLRERAAHVDAVDDEVRRLAGDMFDTMYEADGVGLAAPQVGIARRLIVVDSRDPDVEPMAVINPRVVTSSSETDRAEEGCLSIPGIREVVERPGRAVIEGLDLEGRPIRVEAKGLLARIFQHEIDHIDGILFIDRISPLKRRFALRRWDKVKPVTDHVPPDATKGGL